MSVEDSSGRVYGKMYQRTSLITDLPALAACMLDIVNESVGRGHVPVGAEFAFLVSGSSLGLKAHGLTDRYLYSSPDVYTAQANELDICLTRFLELFNWSNPHDGMDRRFFPRVDLLSEELQKYSVFPPGQVWVLRGNDEEVLPKFP